jgi:hypothetical protein
MHHTINRATNAQTISETGGRMSVGSNRRRRLTLPAALVAVFALGAVSATPAFASGKPVVETEPATGLKETEATLKGTVNPEELATTYYFEYGTEKGELTHKTAEASAGSGIKAVEERKTITGLAVSMTYYYRIVATNTEGTSYGAEVSFATTTKPTVETKPATGVVGTEAKLHGVTNPHGAPTKYYFEYGLASEKVKYEHKTAELSAGSGTINEEVGQIVTELTATTSYRFRIVVSNINGTAEGSELTFTTTTVSLPEFVLGEGETFPVALEGALPSAKSNLRNEAADIACEGLKAKGSITGARALSLTLDLEKCAQSSIKCNTAGAEVGLVVLPGNATLVYIDKAKKEVGVLLGLTETAITCGESNIKVKGSVIIPVTPVNTKTSKVDLALKGNGKGKQAVTEYETERGELKKATLELTAAKKTSEAALEVPEELDLTANKELTISA